MHADSMPVLDAENLGEGKLSDLSHNSSSAFADATGVCASSTVSHASSNSHTLSP